MAKYSKIKNFDIANGSGIGISIYFNGCDAEPKCKGCFNSELWEFNTGKLFNKDTISSIIEYMDNIHINHLSILGGEPLAEKNIYSCDDECGVIDLCKKIKSKFPNKKIWIWTHYNFEDLLNKKYKHFNDIYIDILPYIDILVDGRFVEDLKNINLKFAGSTNQRVIDVQKSLQENKIVLYKENTY